MRRYMLAALVLAGCHQPPAPCPVPTSTPTPARGFPVRLAWGGGVADADIYQAAYQAVIAWNQGLGREVFTFATVPGPVVFLTLESGPISIAGQLAAGLTVGRWQTGMIVRLDRQMRDAHTANILTHELGHVLGAGHSEDPADVMYPLSKPSATLTPSDLKRAADALSAN